MIHSYVACVLSRCCVCVCNGFASISCVFWKCFRCIFQTFHLCSYVCRKRCIWMLRILYWLYRFVASVCFNCFKRMLQVFYLYVAYVAMPIHMLQAYVVNVSSLLNVCYSKCFLRCKCFSRCSYGRRQRWSPRVQRSPCAQS